MSTSLSLSQQAALIPERMRRSGSAATLYVAVELPADAGEHEIGSRATGLIERHEILRTVYPDDKRMPYHHVIDVPDSILVVGAASETELPALLQSDAARGFDTVRELPLRIRLYRLPTRSVLSVAVHPVAADDRSIDLIVAELLGNGPQLSVPQYRDYVSAQLATLARPASTDPDLAYWTETLADLPERSIQIDAALGPVGHRAVVEIPVAPVAALPEAVDASAVALVSYVLRALNLAADDALAVGVVAHDAAAPDGGIGNYANHVVVRTDRTSPTTPREFSGDAARALAGAREHGATRIERIAHQLRPRATGPLCDVLVSVRTAGPVAEIARTIARPFGTALVVDVLASDSGVALTVDVAGSSEALADQVAQSVARAAQEWAAAPDATIELRAPIAASIDGGVHLSGHGGPLVTDSERVVANALRTILDLDDDQDIGRDDTFFSLGGDSIAALRLVTDLADRGYVLDVQTVFGCPVVRDLAEQLTTGSDAEPQAAPDAAAPMSASGLDDASLQALAGRFGTS